MNFAWVHSPLWLIINGLVAYRLTRLWIVDTLPPLPRIRKWIDARASWWSIQYGQLGRFDRDHPGDLTEAEQHRRDELVAKAERRIDLYHGEPALAVLATCYWCSGFWIGLAVFLLASLLPAIAWTVLAVPLAFSATTGLLSEHAK